MRVYTRLRSTPPYLLLPVFLAVYIPCSIVVLVPIDLASSSNGSAAFFYLSTEARLILWRIIYWGAFFLTWAILPGLQGFVDSGYHGTTRKIADSFRRNAKYQLALLVVGGIGLLYIIMSSGLSFSAIKALAIASSHSYALVLALWLMGHGFINFPRTTWVEASPSVRLRHLYQQAMPANDALAEAVSDYVDIAAEVFALGPFRDIDRYTSWINSLLELVEAGPGIPLANHGSAPVTGHSRTQVERSMITDDYLSSLTARFKTARSRLVRYDAEWQKILREASRAEDIVQSKEKSSLVFRFKNTPLPPKAAYWYYAVIRPQVQRFFSVFCAVLSAVIVWSEITHGTVLSIVNLSIKYTSGFWQQTLSSLFLGYMCVCALSSLTRIRVFKIYALVYRHTDLSSLLFYSMYACRLTVPLSFNFITLITSRDSVFEDFLGKFINLTPLGKYFNDWLPRFILIPMIMTTFHVYDRVRDFFGFGFSFDDEESQDYDEQGRPLHGSVVEGKHLVRRSLTDMSYRYSIRHANIAAASSGNLSSSGYSDSTSSLLDSNDRSNSNNNNNNNDTEPNDYNTRTSFNHIGNSALGQGRQLGGRKFNRSRADDQRPYSDVSPAYQGSSESLNNTQNGLALVDGRIKGFFTGIGEKLKGLKKPSNSNASSNDSEGLIPRWRQANTSTQYQDENDDDDDDDEDMPLTL